MQPEFWFDSWDKGGFCTSFHRRDVHPFIQAHTPHERFAGANVLIPLCGKTNDLLYYKSFARKVVGVELVEKAILEFFEDNKMFFIREGNHYIAGNLTLICGDFFGMTQAELGPVDLIYDRAALVALPLPMRLDYIRTLDRLSHVGTKQIVVTLEYAPILESAPFSIAPEEVVAYYGYGYRIDHVERSLQPEHGMVRRWKLHFLMEHGFLLEKRRDLSPELLSLEMHEAIARTVVARNRRAVSC